MNAIRCSAALILILAAGHASPAQTAATPQQQIEQHTRKAQGYLQQKRPDLAIPEFQAVVTLDPGNVDAQGNLGVLLFFRGEYAKAVPPLRAALSLQPALPKLRMLLGMSEARSGEASAAQQDLEQAVAVLTDPHMLTDAGMELIGLYIARRDLEKAAGVVARLQQADPANPRILYSAYRIYSDLAGESLLDLSLAAPDSAQMHEAMARELAREGNNDAAIAQLKKALAIDPAIPGGHLELAELLQGLPGAKNKDMAEQEYQAALKADPLDEKTRCRLGDIYAGRGDTQKAYAFYSEALRLQPSDEEALLGQAKTLIAMEQPAKALPLLERAVQLEPTDVTAHFRLSNLYRQQGRTEDARREVEQYKKYKDMKENLRSIYKEMRLQPDQNPAAEQDDK